MLTCYTILKTYLIASVSFFKLNYSRSRQKRQYEVLPLHRGTDSA